MSAVGLMPTAFDAAAGDLPASMWEKTAPSRPQAVVVCSLPDLPQARGVPGKGPASMTNINAWLRSLRSPPKNRPLFRQPRLEVEPLELRALPSVATTGSAFLALTGHSYNGVVGSFTLAAGTTASDYSALILWGDGSQSTGTIDGSGNVTGTHTFNAAGTYAVAFQVLDTLDNATGVGVALGLVEDLTQDTQLQDAYSFSVSQTPSATQSGSDGSGAFSLTDTGTLTESLAKLLYQMGGSLSRTASGPALFSVTAAGTDTSDTFAVGDYTISVSTSTTTTTLAEFHNDFTTYTTTSGSATDQATLQTSGNETSGAVTSSVTATHSQ